MIFTLPFTCSSHLVRPSFMLGRVKLGFIFSLTQPVRNSAFVSPLSIRRPARPTGLRRAMTSIEPDRTISDLRKEYSERGLDDTDLPAEPFSLFKSWFEEAVASKVLEPNAMTLSTVDKDCRPSARLVLLKGVDERGFVWYTNYESRKGEHLKVSPAACLTFWWGDLERSIRVEGQVEKVSDEESTAYFQSRPRGSQMGAWASNQSRPIASREELERQYAEVQARFADESVTIPKPPYWGGYRLIPHRIEFWKGRKSRFHDRIEYVREGGSDIWSMQRLQP